MARAWIGGAVLTLAAVAAAAFQLWPTAASPPEGLVASGRIEGDQATVGARVGGTVTRVAVREGMRVDQGAVIAELASDAARAALRRAEYAAETARAELGGARSQVAEAKAQAGVAAAAVELAREASRARVAEAQANLDTVTAQLAEARAARERAWKDQHRFQQLCERELIAARDLDEQQAAYQVAAARVEASQNRVRRAEEALNLARASRLEVLVRG